MKTKESKPFIPFLIGLFFGWIGVRIMVHITYLLIIAMLLIKIIFFK